MNEIEQRLDYYYNVMDGSPILNEYHERHGTQSACILTVYDDQKASDITGWLRPRIENRIVVEIGAGIGLLACHLATVAKRVYAIEVDPAWTSCFLEILYKKKPKNLSFLFGSADDMPYLSADVALFCTHSGHSALWRMASRFAPIVIDVYRELLSDKFPPCPTSP